jgi:hypothetical protein
MEGETVVVTRRVDPERGKSTVSGERRMLMEVVDPEPLTGDHVPFRKETGKSEFMEGERGVVVEKGRQCQSKEAFSGGRKSAGAEVLVVRRSVSVNVTDAVTQSITDDVGMSGSRPSKGCSMCGRDNCKGTGSYCWDPGGVSAVNEHY